ncbi:MAG: NIPSNAP family protein [Steroidobacteraceae bacterium]
MFKSRLGRVLVPAATLAVGIAIGSFVSPLSTVQAQSAGQVYELRTYTAPEGKLKALEARFRDDTVRIFNRHNMKSVGYFTPQDAPGSSNTLVYLLAHPSRDAAKKNWDEFRNDPEWKKVVAETEANGKIVEKVESVFLNPLDFSALK